MKQRTIIVVLLVALVLVFAAAVMFDQRRDSGPSGEDKAAMLVRPHLPTIGPSEARVHVVEFLDPACETCRAFYPIVKELMRANPGRIKLSVRHVAFHDGAAYAVQALEAARLQGKYWQALEALLASQSSWAINHKVHAGLVLQHLDGIGLDLARLQQDMNDPAIARNMALDESDARALRVMKTPEYYINGRQMPKFGREELIRLVQEEIAAKYR